MMNACIDHLVVVASDLASGADWCRQVLGVEPAAGGEHGLMGTHNRLVDVSSPAHPRAYLEIIAVNPAARPTLPSGHRRWFDMDDTRLQAQVAQQGPQLVHWVASVPDIAAATQTLSALELERGTPVAASRATPRGLLQWQISLRADGQRLMDGCLPTLIQWGDQHPCEGLPASGLQLQSLELSHPGAARLRQAGQALELATMQAATQGGACLRASLSTPRGALSLCSPQGSYRTTA
ncbi:MAG: VOC family protein [Burkholderiaceae bacterium]|jgi:hypothetical protein|nr:VOC family protein [Burkholderiaceae bacterium]